MLKFGETGNALRYKLDFLARIPGATANPDDTLVTDDEHEYRIGVFFFLPGTRAAVV